MRGKVGLEGCVRFGVIEGWGEGIFSWEKIWNIWFKIRNLYRDFGLKFWKIFVFVFYKKTDDERDYLKDDFNKKKINNILLVFFY